MTGLMTFIKDNFSVFLEVMFFVPSSSFQISYVSEVVLLVFILTLALTVIFLCDRLLKKYDLRFTTSVLLTFLVLSLTLGLTGIFLSILRLDMNMSNAFVAVGIGSPIFNLVLGVIASVGNRLRKNHPKTSTLLLCGVGFLFAWVLLTTFLIFARFYYF